jgi:hypothetical protein
VPCRVERLLEGQCVERLADGSLQGRQLLHVRHSPQIHCDAQRRHSVRAGPVYSRCRGRSVCHSHVLPAGCTTHAHDDPATPEESSVDPLRHVHFGGARFLLYRLRTCHRVHGNRRRRLLRDIRLAKDCVASENRARPLCAPMLFQSCTSIATPSN